MDQIYFSYPGNEVLTAALIHNTYQSLGKAEFRKFPDGETYLRIDSDVFEKHVVLVCTLDRPDEKLAALFFFSKIARSLNAKSVTLISPYLPYMRQDKIFNKGEGVTAYFFAQFLSSLFDNLVTIDPHLHRFHSLSLLYSINFTVKTASGIISQWINENIENPFIIGPDSESEQWVQQVAKDCKAPYIFLNKIRLGDDKVEINLPDDLDLSEKTPVLVDDIISTGKTMIETIKLLKLRKSAAPVCIGVHAIFSGNAFEDLKQAGATKIITTNTIVHSSNGIDISELLKTIE